MTDRQTDRQTDRHGATANTALAQRRASKNGEYKNALPTVAKSRFRSRK